MRASWECFIHWSAVMEGVFVVRVGPELRVLRMS